MKYTIENEKGKAKINFTITAEEWESNLEKAYVRTRGKYSVQGFRKGKVPRKIIEMNYGAGVFFDEAFNDSFPKYYTEVLDNNLDLYPVDRPEVSFDDISDTEVKMSAVVTLKPEVTLGEYKGLTVHGVKYNVTDEDVQKEIDSALDKASKMEAVTDRAVTNGDSVILDYSGSVGGVKFDGGTAEKQELVIGSNSFIPGFEEQMIGMKIDENKDLVVSFPADYQAKELAGKEAIFAVTVHEIKTKVLPELNDEFVKTLNKGATVEEYKATIRSDIEAKNNTKAEHENENSLIEAIVNGVTIEVPQCMVNTQLDYFAQEFEYRLQYQGLKLEDYFRYTGSSMEAFRKDRAEEALKAVKTRLTLEKIIKTEDIKVEPTDIDSKLEEIAKSSGKSLEEYRKNVSDKQMSYIENDIMMDKTIKFLFDNNKIKIVKE